MRKPELLVPAGSLEVLKVAVTFGADAVYIGGADVTSATGMPIKAGDNIVIPVVSDKVDAVYVVGGQCVITEFFS